MCWDALSTYTTSQETKKTFWSHKTNYEFTKFIFAMLKFVSEVHYHRLRWFHTFACSCFPPSKNRSRWRSDGFFAQPDTGWIFDLKSSTRRLFGSRTNTRLGASKTGGSHKRIRNANAFQTTAPFKGTALNARHWMGDGDGFQRLALCKTWNPMLATKPGMVMLSKDSHSAKAPFSILQYSSRNQGWWRFSNNCT